MPQVSIARRYQVPFADVPDRWTPAQIVRARTEILRRVSEAYRDAAISIDWDLATPGRLTLVVTTSERTVTHDQVRVALVETMLRDIGDAVDDFGRRITATARLMALTDKGADSVYFQAGLRPSHWDESAHIFQSAADRVTSTVTFDV